MAKVYLNIQEQVEKNRKDILDIQQGATVLAEFGITVIGQADEESELPDPATYLEEGGQYGDAYAVGTEAPYDFYIFTRAFEGQDEPSWFNIGPFPVEGPQGEQGPQGYTPTIGANGNWFINGVDTGLPSRGIQGPQGETGATGQTGSQGIQGIQGIQGPQGPQGPQGNPGAFSINGHITSSDDLPAASSVPADTAYAVGASAPYDVYVIMTVGGVQEWLNLGPVAVVESDTKLGSNNFVTSGTLSQDILTQLVNTTTADFIKIGDRFFAKHSAGHYYALKRDSGVMLIYAMDIDLATGVFSITTETMVDLDTAQTISGEKVFRDLKLSWDSMYDSAKWKIKGGGPGTDIVSSQNKGLYIQDYYISPAGGNNNDSDLGTPTAKWKDLYLSGKINPNANNYGITPPDTTSFTADKKLATTDDPGLFNVINASDIAANFILTPEQNTLIRNGKPTLLNGTFSGTFINTVILPGYVYNAVYYATAISSDSTGSTRIFEIIIYNSNLYIATSGSYQVIGRDGKLSATISYLNNKQFPAYPSSTGTFVLKCVDGVLTWVAE